jgi:hypothetical protein
MMLSFGHRFLAIHSPPEPISIFSFKSNIKSFTSKVFLAFNHVKTHSGTCSLFTHSLLGSPSMQLTQQQESWWYRQRVGSLDDKDRTWCFEQLPFIIEQSHGPVLLISPTSTSWKNLLMCYLTFGYTTWYSFASNFKNVITLVALWNFLPLGLICFFLTSHFSKAPTLSTSPFPWLVAKKIQINWHPLGWFVKLVRLGYHDRKCHAFALSNWLKQPSLQTMWLLGVHLWLCRWLQWNMKACWTNSVSWLVSFETK